VTAVSDPQVREIGRLEDSQGRILIVGVNYDTVTLRTLHTRTSGAVELGALQTEELGRLVVSAAWQAAAQTAADISAVRDGQGAGGDSDG
jgi:hypothetical protein